MLENTLLYFKLLCNKYYFSVLFFLFSIELCTFTLSYTDMSAK